MRRVDLPRRFRTVLGGFALMVALSGCYIPGAPVPSPTATVGQGTTAGPLGATCYAGAYVCGLATPGQIGTTCSCPGLGAPSYGVIN